MQNQSVRERGRKRGEVIADRAVSYTHLDVYKRQALSNTTRMFNVSMYFHKYNEPLLILNPRDYKKKKFKWTKYQVTQVSVLIPILSNWFTYNVRMKSNKVFKQFLILKFNTSIKHYKIVLVFKNKFNLHM